MRRGKRNPPAVSGLERLLRSGCAPDHAVDGIGVVIDGLGLAWQWGQVLTF